jgi:hypothetical protein
MLKLTEPHGAAFWRFRLVRALSSKDENALWKIAQELVEQLGDPDISVAVRTAPGMVAYWLTIEPTNASHAFRFLVTSIAAFVAGRRMPALPWMLQMMTDIVTDRSDLLDTQALTLAEIGLLKMQDELRYKERKEGSGIPDDNVPSIRFYCASLALAMREHLQRSSVVIDAWVNELATDPLPEMRLLAQQSSL